MTLKEADALRIRCESYERFMHDLQNDCKKLQRFKDFVHTTLDKMGVPTHIDGPHSKEGCRIGDRLDWIKARL